MKLSSSMGTATAALACLLVLGCTEAPLNPSLSRDLGELQSIEYIHSVNWPDSHPTHWQLVVARDGDAVLQDSINALDRERRTSFGPAHFRRIEEYLQQTDFTSLEADYGESKGEFSEFHSYAIRAEYERGEKTVRCDPGFEPTLVWALQHMLYEMKGNGRWQNG